MKKLKRLSREQKKFLESRGMNSKNYLVERNTITEYRFFNKETNKIEIFFKDGGCE